MAKRSFRFSLFLALIDTRKETAPSPSSLPRRLDRAGDPKWRRKSLKFLKTKSQMAPVAYD
jgi:hypothetical protein